MKLKYLAAAACLAIFPTHAAADCAIENDTPVSLISNAFEAWKAVGEAMSECGNVTTEHSNEFISKQGVAFEQSPSLYQLGGVANSSIQPLLAGGLLRPLDDLVEEYGDQLSENQLITYDGQIMAVAMMINAQHWMYRADIFEELGLEPPKTYDDVLATAQAIRESGAMQYPLGGTYEAGWNLGQEFVNLYIGNGGTFFDDERQPAIANEVAVATLETMKELAEYMDPEYLLSNQTAVIQQFQNGDIAMANLWADSAGPVNDPEASQFPGQIAVSAAPMGDMRPASTLWWDGVVLARNQSDESAAAAFQVAMEGIDGEMAGENPEKAIWLIDGVTPGELAQGAIQTAEQGAITYPASPEMGLLHDRIGSQLAFYFNGDKSAEKVLADIEVEYVESAREAGFLD